MDDMDDWMKWMQFSCRMVIYAMQHTPERKNKVLKSVIDFINSYRGTKIMGWDEKHEENGYMGDSIYEYFDDGYRVDRHGELVQTRFFRDICSAVRAGIDIVLPEQWQGGVVGFTAGDVRKMYPEGLPQWLRKTLDSEYAVDGKTTPFHEIPDEEHIWL